MKNKKQYLIQLLLIGIFCFIPSLMVGQTYKIYSTRNYYNQLRLNTMTGEVQQIQDDGQSWEICSARAVSENKVGRFCLYKKCIFSIQTLTNMYQYYLINDNTEDMWKFQWSTKGDDYRWIEKFK